MKRNKFDFRLSPDLRCKLKAALTEDVGSGDTTSETLVPKGVRGCAVVIAKESGLLCGTEIVRELFRISDSKLRVHFNVQEGAVFSKGQTLLKIQGRIRPILEAERTALNFLGHLSGIATKAQEFVKKVSRYSVSILGTRKTTPLWRELQKYAIRVGGGRNHRMGLWDTIFVKENHRPYGDLSKLNQYPGRFHIEVRNFQELEEALALRPRVILFDNFSPDQLKKAVKIARRSQPTVILEASGGIQLHNVQYYAATGVDWISIGSLTHSTQAINLSLLIEG